MSFNTVEEPTRKLSFRIQQGPGESLLELCKCTKFTRREIQLMYRTFKQVIIVWFIYVIEIFYFKFKYRFYIMQSMILNKNDILHHN